MNIKQWLVLGGSWGSTLALAYAETHPANVMALVLRGVFLCRPEEIRWFYQEGTSWIFPDFWEDFIKPVPPEKRHDMLKAYYELLTSPDEKTRLEAATAWSTWEGSTCKLKPDTNVIGSFAEAHLALSISRIECHYFTHDCWLEENQLLHDVHRIRHIPTWIVHGRYDVICPAQNAWDLHKAFPESKLHLISDAGHAYDEPGILDATINATDACKTLTSTLLQTS